MGIFQSVLDKDSYGRFRYCIVTDKGSLCEEKFTINENPSDTETGFFLFPIKGMDVKGDLVDSIPLREKLAISKYLEPNSCIIGSIVGVIESLYLDEIAPTTSDILRRFAERYTEPPVRSENHLLAIVGSSTLFSISRTIPCVVHLISVPSGIEFKGWVNPYDDSYIYPKSVWEGMDHFVTCATFSNLSFLQTTGGRYCMARFIKDFSIKSSIPCSYCADFIKSVSHYSLGRLCHLVQAAINRGILCYEEKVLQPAITCRHLSQVLLSKLSLLPNSDEIQTIEELETYLVALLLSSPSNQLDMSQVKKSLIREFGKLLNPRRLGFIKVSEIFTRSNLFRIETTTNNTVIIKL
jgi:hypothetical protein